MEYVIYCRRSSDDWSWKQEQSIPDQIDRCMKYAYENKITIALKPDNFSDFESKQDIINEDNDPDPRNREIYKTTRSLFIIKESKSAKAPGKREKWKKLIQKVKDWKIAGILSYSPDRQARNILEWGEIINLVDENLLFLKYTNFHFENTASGKMMLWVWFVFAKQYSDGISESVNRWNEFSVGSWKSLWHPKRWYTRDSITWKHAPNQYFDLIKEAFHLKIYQHKTNVYIANRLNNNWWKKIVKGKAQFADDNKLAALWKDPFYYWKYVVWGNSADQFEMNPDYKPMISFSEYEILQTLWRRKWLNVKKKRKEELDEITSIPWSMIKSEDGYTFSPNLPNKKRYTTKLTELLKTKPTATLQDVVQSHQIRYSVKQKSSQYTNLEATWIYLERQIASFLRTFKISKSQYDDYVWFMKNKLDELHKDTTYQIQVVNVRINDYRWEQKQYIEQNMGVKKDKKEQEIYNNKKIEYENKISQLEESIKELRFTERDSIIEFEMFLDMMIKAGEYYEKGSFVQKRKICEIFFSNMIFDKNWELHITPKPVFQALFEWFSSKYKKDSRKGISFGADDETRTRNQLLGRQWL